MPRRQRFKPSRKPKPAIEPSEQEVDTSGKPTIGPETHDMNVGQRADLQSEERHPDDADDGASR